MKVADLHLHTRYSDGVWSPAEVVREAARRGLAAIAITDHDTLDAIPEALEAAVGRVPSRGAASGDAAYNGIEVIPGVEITCHIDMSEVHMLGYFFGDAWKDRALRAVLEHAKHIRQQRVEHFVAKLNQLGVALTLADVAACSDCGTLGRPHVAMALVRRKVVGSVEEAFERFLKRGKPGYVERYRMTAAEAIGHIRRAGGIAVLAHPGLNRVDHRLRELTDQGMGGLEVWHSRHSVTQVERYRQLAHELNLVPTGGSDCHGPLRGAPLLGTVTVPYERLQQLRHRAVPAAV
jgi:hypothetical protein